MNRPVSLQQMTNSLFQSFSSFKGNCDEKGLSKTNVIGYLKMLKQLKYFASSIKLFSKVETWQNEADCTTEQENDTWSVESDEMSWFALETCELNSHSWWRVWLIVTLNNRSIWSVSSQWFYRSSSVSPVCRLLCENNDCIKSCFNVLKKLEQHKVVTHMNDSLLDKSVSVSIRCFNNSCFMTLRLKQKAGNGLYFTHWH